MGLEAVQRRFGTLAVVGGKDGVDMDRQELLLAECDTVAAVNRRGEAVGVPEQPLTDSLARSTIAAKPAQGFGEVFEDRAGLHQHALAVLQYRHLPPTGKH